MKLVGTLVVVFQAVWTCECLFSNVATKLSSSIPWTSTPTKYSEEESNLLEKTLGKWRSDIFSGFNLFASKAGSSDNPDTIRFCLYNNPRDPLDFQLLDFHDEVSLKNAAWVPGAEVKVAIHGFTQSQNTSMPGVVKDAYLSRMAKTGEKYNVIAVDWGRLAFSLQDTSLPIYTSAVKNVKVAGIRTGQLLSVLYKLGVIVSPELIHIIGFSLGAHVAGEAGREFEKAVGVKVKRITGLDPAGPLFYAGLPSSFLKLTGEKLTAEDGLYVDVIHTSWGSYGIAEDIGQADFHPNFAFGLGNARLQTQPQCLNVWATSNPLLQVCSHNLAPVFFAMSIELEMSACKSSSYVNYEYYGRSECATKRNFAPFGEEWSPSNTGLFYSEIPKRLD